MSCYEHYSKNKDDKSSINNLVELHNMMIKRMGKYKLPIRYKGDNLVELHNMMIEEIENRKAEEEMVKKIEENIEEIVEDILEKI